MTLLSLGTLCQQCNKKVSVFFNGHGLAIVELIDGPVYVGKYGDTMQLADEEVIVHHAPICRVKRDVK